MIRCTKRIRSAAIQPALDGDIGCAPRDQELPGVLHFSNRR